VRGWGEEGGGGPTIELFCQDTPFRQPVIQWPLIVVLACFHQQA